MAEPSISPPAPVLAEWQAVDAALHALLDDCLATLSEPELENSDA